MSFATAESMNSVSRVRSVLKRIEALRPDLDPETETFKAAVVLVTGGIVGQGIHKLAAATGYATEFVARCARRLVDNGVWPDGMAFTDLHEGVGSDAFWADVAVAEGKLCRRRNEDGSIQWAPPGQWWKEFDFVSKAVTGGPVRYQLATIAPSSALKDELTEVEEEPELPRITRIRPMVTNRVSPARPSSHHLVRPAAGTVVILGSTESSDTQWLQ